eukprot:5113190-Pyramimonas_sp.AAC.1
MYWKEDEVGENDVIPVYLKGAAKAAPRDLLRLVAATCADASDRVGRTATGIMCERGTIAAGAYVLLRTSDVAKCRVGLAVTFVEAELMLSTRKRYFALVDLLGPDGSGAWRRTGCKQVFPVEAFVSSLMYIERRSDSVRPLFPDLPGVVVV